MSTSPPVDISVELADIGSSSSPVVINPEAAILSTTSSPVEPDETASYSAFDGGVYYVGDTIFITHSLAVEGREAIDDGLVLTDTIEVSVTSHGSKNVTDTLNLAQTVTGSVVPREISQALTLSETVARNIIFLREVIDGLGFSDQAIPSGQLGPIYFGVMGPETSNLEGELTPGWGEIPYFDVVPPINVEVTDSITFTQTIDRSVVLHLYKVQTLYLEDSVPPVNPFDQFITQTLNFVDYASTGLSATDTLTFSEVISGLLSNSLAQALSLVDSNTHNAIYGRTITDTLVLLDRARTPERVSDALNLSDQVIRVYSVSLSDTLTFSETILRVLLGNVSHSISFTDTVVGMLPEIVDDGLSLVDTITHNVIYLREVTDELNLVDNIAELSRISVCNETFVTSIGIRTGVTFTWPYTGPSLTVNVRNPEFGNSDVVAYNTLIRRSVRNELLTGRPTTWPAIQIFKFSFRALSQADREALIEFWLASAGDEIGYLDHENRQWRGVLISDQPELVQVGPGCMSEVELEFRGELV